MGEFLFPGPHIFIIVVNVNRVLTDEINFRSYLTDFFGYDVRKYSLVLFTQADDLEHDNISLNEYINSDRSGTLSQIIADCNYRYLAISNRWDPNGWQMNGFRQQLAAMINDIRNVNTNRYYPNERANRIFNNLI